MVVSNYVNIKIVKKKVKYYNDLGYSCKEGDIIKFDIKDLKPNSTKKVRVKCDICGKEKELSYNKNIDNRKIYSCSRKCCQYKIEITCLEKYGVINPFQSAELMKNVNNIKINKYGLYQLPH